MGRTSSTDWLLPLGALAVLGMASSLYATHRGVGLTTDSLAYLGAARSMLGGHGLTLSTPEATRPMTDFPPLFPTVLAALGLLGLDLQMSARWLNTVLFGGTIVLAGLAIRHVTSGSLWASLFGGLLTATSADLLRVYSQLMSDPLFICLGLLGLVLVGAYLDTPKPRRLIAASITVGLAFLARYPGAALVATGVLGLLLFSKAGWRRRVLDAAVFAGLSCIGMVLWVTRNWYLAGDPIGEARTVLAVHFPSHPQVNVALDTVWGWLVPGGTLAHGPAKLVGHLPGIRWAMLAAAALAGVVAALDWRYRAKPFARDGVVSEMLARPPSLWLPAIFVLLYAALVILDVSFIDASESINWRLLSPAFIATLVFGTDLWHHILGLWPGSLWTKRGTIIGAALLGGAYADTAVIWTRRAHEEGLEYTARVWRESDTLRKLSALPSDVLVYSNAYDIVTIVTGRPAKELPPKIDRPSGKPNPNYQTELDTMRERLRNGAVVVYLRRATWRQPSYGSEAELTAKLGLQLPAAAADGSIYSIAP
jgi:hypothetical protein